jgi:hypothetical protein
VYSGGGDGPHFIDRSVAARIFQIAIAQGLTHIIELVGVVDAEIGRPLGVVLNKGDIDFRCVFALVDVFFCGIYVPSEISLKGIRVYRWRACCLMLSISDMRASKLIFLLR